MEPAESNATLQGHIKGQCRSRDLLSNSSLQALQQGSWRPLQRSQSGHLPVPPPWPGLRPIRSIGERTPPSRRAWACESSPTIRAFFQVAIREQLARNRHKSAARGPTATSTISSLNLKERKLLDLYYADKIGQDAFAVESRRITTQRMTLQNEIAGSERRSRDVERAIDKFDHVSVLLAELDLESLWEKASATERRVLVEDLIDSVSFYPDRLTVQVAGAPPILVTLEEVRLHSGSKPNVVTARRKPAR